MNWNPLKVLGQDPLTKRVAFYELDGLEPRPMCGKINPAYSCEE
jgi:hypothetical protein